MLTEQQIGLITFVLACSFVATSVVGPLLTRNKTVLTQLASALAVLAFNAVVLVALLVISSGDCYHGCTDQQKLDDQNSYVYRSLVFITYATLTIFYASRIANQRRREQHGG